MERGQAKAVTGKEGQCGHFAVCPRLYEGNPLW